MEKDKQQAKRKSHGNEKPLKLNVSFGEAMSKIVKPKPKTKKPSKR